MYLTTDVSNESVTAVCKIIHKWFESLVPVHTVLTALLYPWLIVSAYRGSERRHYLVSRGNSANTCPNLNTESPMAGLPI